MIRVAIGPTTSEAFEESITNAGALVSPLETDVEALIWTDYSQPDLLKNVLDSNPQLKWVQLPFAGVDAFSHLLHRPIRFTSAKGAYREPVAEHALALCLALARAIPERVRARSWGKKFAVSLYESEVLIVGAGGITEELLRLLKPFGCSVTVVRRSSEPLAGATRTLTFDQLDVALSTADFVVLACALTPETTGLFNRGRLARMKSTSYLVNVARGKHVVTSDLLAALQTGVIAGAALDVTDPEPLPDGHPLWDEPNCLITPHTADTDRQVNRMLADRIYLNTLAYLGKGDWVGEVDPSLGY